MPRLIVHGFTISLDGYGAGPQQSLEAPLGIGSEALHDRMVRTRHFKQRRRDIPRGIKQPSRN
jgi:hypothetical protein